MKLGMCVCLCACVCLLEANSKIVQGTRCLKEAMRLCFFCVRLCLCAYVCVLEVNSKLAQGARCAKEVCVCVWPCLCLCILRPTLSLPKEPGVQKRSVYCIVEDTVAQDQECDPSERPAKTRMCPRWCLEYLMRMKRRMVIVTVVRMMIMIKGVMISL